jgi:hypothetical protein
VSRISAANCLNIALPRGLKAPFTIVKESAVGCDPSTSYNAIARIGGAIKALSPRFCREIRRLQGARALAFLQSLPVE